MNEFIEKLKEKLIKNRQIGRKSLEAILLDIKQTEAEYNNGWIPCGSRLPEKNQRCLIQYNGSMTGYKDYIDVDIYNGERFEFFGITGVIAWQPLPEEYKEGE